MKKNLLKQGNYYKILFTYKIKINDLFIKIIKTSCL